MTTPGGVPNLPLGALTVETLAQQLQDMSAEAMRRRAGQRFPQIFDASTGGNVLNDLTPFGILTRIWSEINALIAASSPSDITGPEDLPGLLTDYIENLPFVGQFVQLLQALLGLYTGDDETLLAIQELFAPIRGLLQAILGIYEGDDPVLLGIEVLFGQLRTIVENLLVILGGDLNNLAGWASRIPLDLLSVILGTYNGSDSVLLTLKGFFAALRSIVGTFNTATGGNLGDLPSKIPFVSDVVTILTGGALPTTSTIDDAAKWFRDNIPSIPTLVSVLTGQPADPEAPLTLPSLQTWAQGILTQATPVPAGNLFGDLPPISLSSLPVAHINTDKPNLLTQGSFNTAGTIIGAEGWEWDGGTNRTTGGGGSAKVTANGTLRRLYSSQSIPVMTGDRVELSGFIKVSGFTGSAGSVNLSIIPFIGSSAQPTIVMGEASSADLTAAASDWVEIGTSFPKLINPGVTSIKVRLAVTSGATAGTVWFDSLYCNKAGLLEQDLVKDLPDAWNYIYQGAQGLLNLPTGKTPLDMFEALANPTSIATTVTNNLGLLNDILNSAPQQILGTVGVNGAPPLGLAEALADGNLTFAEAITVLGSAAQGLAENIGKALQDPVGAATAFVQNAFNGLLGLFGISTTAKNNSITNADNIQETAKAVYNGYFGSGGSGQIAEVQETVKNIRRRLDSGYTIETLSVGNGSRLQDVKIYNATGGTFRLDYKSATTSSIAYNASAATVQSAITALATVGTGNATVNKLTSDTVYFSVFFAPFTQAVVITGAPTGGTFTLTYKGQTTSALAYNATTSAVSAALEALSTVGSGKVIVTGTAGSVYYVQFSPTLSSIELMTASRTFVSGGTITVLNVTDYDLLKIPPANNSLTGSGPFTVILPYWTRPWTTVNAPKELFCVVFGGGGGGGAGDRKTSNSPTESGTSGGGFGGAPGGYIAAELDAATLPEFVYYIAGAGGTGRQGGGRTATSGADSTFGGYVTSQSGQYLVQNILGYYTTNGSAPGAGGQGGSGYFSGEGLYGGPGAAGGSSQLAAGGGGGGGTQTGFLPQNGNLPPAVFSYNNPTTGANGGWAALDGKARAGGGGGGGGGGAWAYRTGGTTYYIGYSNAADVTTTSLPYEGKLGGNGGYPGGGAGGGGGALTFDPGTSSAGINAGNGGNGGNGIIILLYR